MTWSTWSQSLVTCRDDDHQQEDQFFESNENDDSDDFDVNTVPITFHRVVKDAGATILSQGC